ncbi:MAG: hypothetical protein ACMXYF_00560 [Candidatus Woesearchaeota archaeon]
MSGPFFFSERFNSQLGNAIIGSTSFYLLQWFGIFAALPIVYGIYLVVLEFIRGSGAWFGPDLALVLLSAFIGLLVMVFAILFVFLIGLSFLCSLLLIYPNSKMSFSQVFEVHILSSTPLFISMFISMITLFLSYYISYLFKMLPYYFYYYFIHIVPFFLLVGGIVISFYLQYGAWRKVYSIPIKSFLFSQILFSLTIFILFAIILYLLLNPYIFYRFI